MAAIGACHQLGIPVEAMKQGAFTYLTKPVDLEELKKPNMGTVITACLPIDNPAVGIHYYRPIRDGVELRTRYWFGWAVVDGAPRRIPESMPSEELVRNFTIHNATEYPHLAAFLPSLYREESWKPLTAY